jgi:hypothetical protein
MHPLEDLRPGSLGSEAGGRGMIEDAFTATHRRAMEILEQVDTIRGLATMVRNELTCLMESDDPTRFTTTEHSSMIVAIGQVARETEDTADLLIRTEEGRQAYSRVPHEYVTDLLDMAGAIRGVADALDERRNAMEERASLSLRENQILIASIQYTASRAMNTCDGIIRKEEGRD